MFCPSEKLHLVVRRWLNAFQYRLAFSSFVFHLQYFLHLFSTTLLLLKSISNSIPHWSMIMWFGNCSADSLLSHVLHPGRLTTPLESGKAKSTFNMRSWLLTSFFLPSEIVSQEDEGAPIYWSRAPIYWSPKTLFLIFGRGMKRKSYAKTRFCVSLEGLPNGLGAFSSPSFMFENKTKNHVI